MAFLFLMAPGSSRANSHPVVLARSAAKKYEGAYTLDSDCTGTMTFGGIMDPSRNVHWDSFLTEDHKRGRMIRMDEGNMAVRSFEK